MAVSNAFGWPVDDVAVIDLATDREVWAVHDDLPGAGFGRRCSRRTGPA